jgi:hypothetical protein
VEIKHTPTPWRTGALHMSTGNSSEGIHSDSSGQPNEAIARCYGWVGREQQKANADFIVIACNAYDELQALNMQGCDLNLATPKEVAAFAAACRAARNKLEAAKASAALAKQEVSE